MIKLATSTLLLTIALAGCGHKAPPASTTTTRTQTTTDTAAGQSQTDVTQKRVEQADGTQNVQTTTKTNETVPATTPSPR